MKRKELPKGVQRLVDRGRVLQGRGSFGALGRLITRAPSQLVRGKLLGLLSCGIAIHRADRRVALHLLKMARLCLVDEYSGLVMCNAQEWAVRELCRDPGLRRRLLQEDSSGQTG